MSMDKDLRLKYADVIDEDDDGALGLIQQLDGFYRTAGPGSQFIASTGEHLQNKRRAQSFTARFARNGRHPLRGSKLHPVAFTVVLAILLVTATIAFAAGTGITSGIHIFPFGKYPGPGVVQISDSPPPPSDQFFRPLDPAEAAQQSGYPIAYLATVPHSLKGQLGVQLFPPSPWLAPQWRAPERVVSLVRYRGRHTVFVDMFQLAPNVQKHPISLCCRAVHLSNGQKAWTNIDPGTAELDYVTVVKGDYIVTLNSDEPMASVEQLAMRVTVAPPSGKPTSRGIPASWPPPLPPSKRPAGVVLALFGAVSHDVAQGKPQLLYAFNFANQGKGHEKDLNFRLVLPKGLSFSKRHPRRRREIRIGSGNGAFGGNIGLYVKSPVGFRGGLRVKATWISSGTRMHRTFHFPFVSRHAYCPVAITPEGCESRQQIDHARSAPIGRTDVIGLFPALGHGCNLQRVSPSDVPVFEHRGPMGRLTGQATKTWTSASAYTLESCPPLPSTPRLRRLEAAASKAPIWFRVDGAVQYKGGEASVRVVTSTPSPQVVTGGMNLGNPAGRLSDGIELYSLSGQGREIYLEWFEKRVIVQMTSSDLTLHQMEKLAGHIAIS